jgi:threonine aldolase
MARRLEAAICHLPGISISYPVQSNAVFAKIPEAVVEGAHQRGWKFYTHVGGWEESRLMCSWDTTAEDVDAFAADLRDLAMAQAGKGSRSKGARTLKPLKSLKR